jgi:anti-sigma regulatory factor (Ser/Thr protein kinase)
MTTQDYTGHGSDFADVDALFAGLLAELPWLGAEDAHLARMGLHELQVNIRTLAFHGDPGDIDVCATVTPHAVTVILEDAGDDIDPASDLTPRHTGGGTHGIPILDQAFDQVTYLHGLGRNRWILRRFAPPGATL